MESSSEELSQSLSGSQYDAQNASEEWTILSDEDNECPDIEEEEDNECLQRLSAKESFESEITETNGEINSGDENRINETIESLVATEPKTTDSANNSSDIDVIDEEDDDYDSSGDEMSTASLCSSSVVSQMSNLSLLRDQYLRQSNLLSPDFLNEDLSESSSLNYRELATDTELRRGPRAYVHTPNTGLNGKLNLILILSVSTVIGLGIGNFIGWSNNWKQQKQLSLGQVLKLKQLQDELVVCMQNQADKTPLIDGHIPQVCLTDNDYWRGKFEILFSENKGLFSALQKTQKHFQTNGDIDYVISDKDCDNKSASDEFHKLKLHFLVSQMEHLKLLKTLEEVKYKGKQSEKRVQDLEVENSHLKMKLVEEEEDDEVIVQSWSNRVAKLRDENLELRTKLEDDEEEDSVVLRRMNDRIQELLTENNELKAALNQLEAQVVMVDNNAGVMHSSAYGSVNAGADSRVPIKLHSLKQRINQMVIENDELKSTIARLRWSYPQRHEESDQLIDEEADGEDITAEEMSRLEEKLNQLKDLLTTEQNESKKWKELYENLKTKSGQTFEHSKNERRSEDTLNENVIFDWILNSTNVLKEALITSSTVVGDRLIDFFNKMTDNESIFPSHILSGINSTQSMLFDLNRRLQERWQELQHLRTEYSSGSQRISNKMSKLLEQTLRKLQNAGNKLLSTDSNLKTRFEHFSNKVSKLIDNLDNKWNDLLLKMSKSYSKEWSEDKEDINPKSNWFFERANSRRGQQSADSAPYEANSRSAKSAKSDTVIGESEAEDMSDSGVEEEVEENWFLKKAKKPKFSSDYDMERPKHRDRKMRFRLKFGQRLGAHSRQR